MTDRLHASILAFLMHKPHIILDHKYNKLKMTRKVAFDTSPSCQDETKMRYREANTLEMAVQIAAEILS